jgi:hypothetical protein
MGNRKKVLAQRWGGTVWFLAEVGKIDDLKGVVQRKVKVGRKWY